jgi:hypothetical protein
MNNKLEILAYIILLVGVVGFALIPIDSKHAEKITYCRIDSVVTTPKDEFIPEIVNKCWTDCGYVFSSKKNYHIGDSIQVKTIIIE